ncbi:hypothetical protein SNEBB_011376, partial [Seison nebaliae]
METCLSKNRWKILAKAIKNGQLLTLEPLTTQLTNFSVCDDDQYSQIIWYKNEEIKYEDQVKIVKATEEINLEDLTGFDNTGNVRIWAAEYVAIHDLLSNNFILQHFKENVKGIEMIELGSGMNGLLSLFISKRYPLKRCIATDGNSKCINCLRE